MKAHLIAVIAYGDSSDSTLDSISYTVLIIQKIGGSNELKRSNTIKREYA